MYILPSLRLARAHFPHKPDCECDRRYDKVGFMGEVIELAPGTIPEGAVSNLRKVVTEWDEDFPPYSPMGPYIKVELECRCCGARIQCLPEEY